METINISLSILGNCSIRTSEILLFCTSINISALKFYNSNQKLSKSMQKYFFSNFPDTILHPFSLQKVKSKLFNPHRNSSIEGSIQKTLSEVN